MLCVRRVPGPALEHPARTCCLLAHLDSCGSTLRHPPSRYRSTKRSACLGLSPSTPAADSVVRLPASTSVKTSNSSQLLLVHTQPIHLPPSTLDSGWGSDNLALKSYDMAAALSLHSLNVFYDSATVWRLAVLKLFVALGVFADRSPLGRASGA